MDINKKNINNAQQLVKDATESLHLLRIKFQSAAIAQKAKTNASTDVVSTGLVTKWCIKKNNYVKRWKIQRLQLQML